VRPVVLLALAFVLGSLVGCARPPRAALDGLGAIDPERMKWLAGDQRLAVTLAHGCEADDPFACEKLGSLYFVGRGVPKHPFHALALWTYACEKGVGVACEQAGAELVSGAKVPRDLERAVQLYDTGCAHQRASACTRAGELWSGGLLQPGAAVQSGLTPAPRRAARAFRRGCDRGDPAGCHALALALLEGRGVTQDAKSGIALLERACTSEHATSCRQLATLHGEGLFLKRDGALARTYQQRACEVGDGGSCTEVALLARDEGKLQEAIAAFEAACDAGDTRGCALLGDAWVTHDPPDPARAAEPYARACQGGLWEACGRVAALEGAGGIDAPRLRGLYRLACDAGEMTACDWLAGMLLDGIGGPSDPAGAARLYDRACEKEVASSCVHLAWMGRDDGGSEPLAWLERACDLDPLACVVLGEVHELGLVEGGTVKNAADAYQRGCAADDAGACERLASLYYRGRGVARDDAVAARLFSVACDGGRPEACAELGFMHEKGLGVSASPTWAVHYRARACELGFAASCVTADTKVGKTGNPPAKPSVPSK
jgi:TPR repeat protein